RQRRQQLSAVAHDPGRLVDDVGVAEREVAGDVTADPEAGGVERRRHRRVQRARVDGFVPCACSNAGAASDPRTTRAPATMTATPVVSPRSPLRLWCVWFMVRSFRFLCRAC